MNATDTKLIADMDAAEKRATGAPWSVRSDSADDGEGDVYWLEIGAFCDVNRDTGNANMTLAVAARNVLPRLLELVRAQDAALGLADIALSVAPDMYCPERPAACDAVRRALGKEPRS